MPSGAPGDLSDFLRTQRPDSNAIELFQSRERDVVYVHIEAHADRVGCDEKVDVAGLVERDLSISRAWT
jgi:hypothetical protein